MIPLNCIDKSIDLLSTKKGVEFKVLYQICSSFFEGPRAKGSHNIFKVPWPGEPRINIQKDGKFAKRYQIKQIHKALKKLKNLRCENEKS